MVDATSLWKIFLVLLTGPVVNTNARVVELGESFGDQYKQGNWLVKFYAPWCGHCKKLAPIYHDVGNSLRNTDVVVAKMDATRYSLIASEFEVRGYPTIKFFTDGNVHTYQGERSKEDIVEFVKKARGPAVRSLASIGRFNEAKSAHSGDVFFMFVGTDDPNNDLYRKYSSIAKEQVAVAYFYSGSRKVLPDVMDISLKNYPTVLVFKDKTVYEYEPPKGVATMGSLQQWIKGEKFTAYPLVTGGNINQMADTGKLLVIFVINEKIAESKALNEGIKGIGRSMAVDGRSKYHSAFQFLWMDDPETANSIMMTFITMPYVLILDPTLHVFYVPNTDINKLDAASLGTFLEDILANEVQPLGGTGFFQRLKRVFYELIVTVISVWESSTWLFLLMFGLPTAVISIVCYSLCCMDTIDEQIQSDEESDTDEEYVRLLQEQERQRGLEKEERTDNQNIDPSHLKSE